MLVVHDKICVTLKGYALEAPGGLDILLFKRITNDEASTSRHDKFY